MAREAKTGTIRLLTASAPAVIAFSCGAVVGCAGSRAGMHEHAVETSSTSYNVGAVESFQSRMDTAMAAMGRGMANARLTGNADHDFAAMMIPHHRGAIDMAKAELLYGRDPVLRRLAQEVIVTQGSEIVVMQLELKK